MDITFGVIGTAGIALHSARRVYELVSGIRGAPEAVSNVSRDVKALSNALEMLQTMLRTFHEPEQLKMVPMLQLPLDNCIEILHDIEIKIKPYIKTQIGKPSIWRGFVWAFREKDILSMQNTLLAYKQSLDIAISISDYSNNLSSSSDTRNNFHAVRRSIRKLNRRLDADRDSVANDTYAGSEAGSSDYAYNMKQWLLSAETVFEEVATDGTLDTELLKLESDADLDIEEASSQAVGSSHIARLEPNDQQALVEAPIEKQKNTHERPRNLGIHAEDAAAHPTVNDSTTAEIKSKEDQQDASTKSLTPLFRRLSLGLEDGTTLAGPEMTDFQSTEPSDLSSAEGRAEIAIPTSSASEPPTKIAVPLSNLVNDFAVSGVRKAKSTNALQRAPNGQPMSALEKSMTHLLVATKQLLESLTKWSTNEASEQDVSDIYVRLGYEFNVACRIFTLMEIDISHLGPVPDTLRVVLEQTLSQETSPENLERYLPRIRDIMIDLLRGLKRVQIVERRKKKEGLKPITMADVRDSYARQKAAIASKRTALDIQKVALEMEKADFEKKMITAKMPEGVLSPVQDITGTDKTPGDDIKVGDILIAAHAFEKRSEDEIGFPKNARIKIMELDDDFGDGWLLGEVVATGKIGLFPQLYTRKPPAIESDS